MRYDRSLAAVVLVSLTAAGFAAAHLTGSEKCDNASFVKMASCANLSEIKMGKIAQENSSNSEVKAFAAEMVKGHTKAQEDLKVACKTSKTECPDKVTKEGQEACEKCDKVKSAKNFDAVYIGMQIECHEKALKLYTQASKECECEMIKAYASDHIPTIREHLATAKKIQANLEGKSIR